MDIRSILLLGPAVVIHSGEDIFDGAVYPVADPRGVRMRGAPGFQNCHLNEGPEWPERLGRQLHGLQLGSADTIQAC